MPTLDWIGKKAVLNHHREVPYHLLKCDKDLSAGDPDSGNLLVQGDNLLALKALLPYYAGKVKCIYIDPPYNTGNEGWVYNDAVNSPEMQAWLGKAVGREAEDLSRHDKWLCMMYPRLALAREFLSDDGAIFVSIDDIELPRLRLLMDELFQSENLVACFAWQTEGNFDNQAKVKICHEYILMYARRHACFQSPPVIDPSIPKGSKLFKNEIQNTIVKNGPKNPVSEIELPKGFPASFKEGVIQRRTDTWPHYSEDVIVDQFSLAKSAIAKSGWSSKDICLEFIRVGFKPVLDSKGQETTFALTKTGAIECIKRRPSTQSHVISVLREVGTTQQASAQLREMDIEFDYPKPLGLIRYLLSMVRGTDLTVLDFFAGSGTTGHAVLALNKADGGNRRFILVEMDEKICRDVTAQRLRRVIEGYGQGEEKVPGLGGGFRYCTLAEPLFDELGNIRSGVKFPDLAAHVFFTETGSPIPKRATGKTPLLGAHEGKAVYLLFNGVLADKRPDGGNVLTGDVLKNLPAHDGPKIVYGEGCRLGAARLKREGIVFKQVPYEIKVR